VRRRSRSARRLRADLEAGRLRRGRLAVALEPALSRFAAAAHLTFVEIALAPVRRGLAVVLVDTLPRLEHFALAARARIIDSLVALLVPEREVAPAALRMPS
jgi:hypothetical protein